VNEILTPNTPQDKKTQTTEAKLPRKRVLSYSQAFRCGISRTWVVFVLMLFSSSFPLNLVSLITTIVVQRLRRRIELPSYAVFFLRCHSSSSFVLRFSARLLSLRGLAARLVSLASSTL
jgi:hypothetical protein